MNENKTPVPAPATRTVTVNGFAFTLRVDRNTRECFECDGVGRHFSWCVKGK